MTEIHVSISLSFTPHSLLQALIDLQWPSERGCFRWFTLIHLFSSPHKSAVFASLNTCVFPFSPLTLSAVVLQNRSVQALLVGDSCRLNCRLKTMIQLLFSLILSLCSFYMSYCGWWLRVVGGGSVCVAIMKIKVMQWLNRKKCP